jgi:hypothetical protein
MSALVTVPLSVRSIEAMQGGPARVEHHDAACPGLYFVVQPNGTKSWAVRYRVAGERRKLTLGRYPAIGLSSSASCLARRFLT